ncbi:HIT family protein [archaeon]|nr:HIT family protein [archaeon]
MAKEFILFETNFWKVILLDEQSYLGRCVVVLKRDCGELSGLTTNEAADFHENIVNKLETTLKKTFNATMFNWSCLMNDAYKEKNPKPQVHWHFRPRYNHPVQIANNKFIDLDFANHYNNSSERKKFVSEEILEQIFNEIKNNL